MKKLLIHARNKLYLPLAMLIIYYSSLRNRIRCAFQKTNVVKTKPFQHKNIFVLALYEKYELRDDIKRLVHHIKSCHPDTYVLAVNTLKLKKNLKEIEGIDCYIEIPNYGRDFGSYKTAFMHMYKQGWHKDIQRALMSNDSIFYSERGLTEFTSSLLSSNIDVLGATENHEFEYHLGSFCISISGDLVRKSKFKQYWKDYKKTDVRPLVIKRGELGLSKVLKSIARSDDHFHALFNVANIFDRSVYEETVVNDLLYYNRSSINWADEALTPKKMLNIIWEKYIYDYKHHDGEGGKKEKKEFYTFSQNENKIVLATLDNLVSALMHNNDQNTKAELKDIAIDSITNEYLHSFYKGSQIHKNGIFLLKNGLSIIKLDAVYRGVYNASDVRKLCSLLPDQEANELRAILYKRPYGLDVLRGWKLAAFSKGLI